MGMACFNGHSEVVAALAKAGAWVNTLSLCHPGTYSPLMFAATEGHADTVRTLIHGAWVNYGATRFSGQPTGLRRQAGLCGLR